MIRVTDHAAGQLKQLVEGKPGQGLRLSVSKGGCAGWQYQMKIDAPQPDDTIFSENGGKIIVDPESLKMLDGSTVDFSDSLSDGGFKITNPQAARSCGCGTSFETAADDKEPEYDSSMDGSVCGSEN
ncbi:MAG: iron-sulfur cluster assembly accessory protein [Verrucomicrobiota bacterium]